MILILVLTFVSEKTKGELGCYSRKRGVGNHKWGLSCELVLSAVDYNVNALGDGRV